MTTLNACGQSFPVALTTVIRANRFVKLVADGLIEECDAGEEAIGVAKQGSTATQDFAITVDVVGSSAIEVEAGAAIDVSSGAVNVMSDADGRAVTATSGNYIIGTARESASGAGSIISVWASPKSQNAT